MAARPAHQFLVKPCDPKRLERALQRINQVRLDHDQGRIRRTFGAHRRLPSPVKAMARLRAALDDNLRDLAAIGDIVSADIAMTAQVLRLVNAAFFGPPVRTFDPRRAVAILGPDLMKRLLDEVELFRLVGDSVERGEPAGA
jgi:hypothetical protein